MAKLSPEWRVGGEQWVYFYWCVIRDLQESTIGHYLSGEGGGCVGFAGDGFDVVYERVHRINRKHVHLNEHTLTHANS